MVPIFESSQSYLNFMVIKKEHNTLPLISYEWFLMGNSKQMIVREETEER